MTRLEDLLKKKLWQDVCCKDMENLIKSYYIDSDVNGNFYLNLGMIVYPLDMTDVLEIKLKYCPFCGLPIFNAEEMKKLLFKLKQLNQKGYIEHLPESKEMGQI